MRSKINMQQVYASTVRDYQAAKFGTPGGPDWPIMGTSDIILTSAITTGMSVATFNLNVNSGPAATAWEVRLQQTDSFKITRMGVYAYGLIGTSTGPAGSTSYKWWTYAPWELAKAFVTIAPIWDSAVLSMILNSKQYVRNLTSNRSFQIPRTQMSPFQALTTSGSANSGSQANITLGEDGMFDVEPTMITNGNWNNQITLTLQNPAGVAPVTNFSYTTDNADNVFININYINLKMEGLLIQNATAILGPPGGY